MARKLKKKIEIKYSLDSRERDITLLKTLKIDKRINSDKIKFVDIEQKCFKCDGVKTSTGDLGFEYKLEGDTEWRKSKLSIELKRKSDLFSTLFSGMKRFGNEIQRAEDAELDFYIVHDWTLSDVKNHVKKLQAMRKMGYKSNPYITFINNYIKIAKRCNIICCGNDFEEVIRRICKNYIIENKLQYED